MFNGISPDQFSEWLKNPRWSEKPATIHEFVYGKDYLNQGNNVYRFIFQLLRWVFGDDPNVAPVYNDVTILAGIGCLAGDTLVHMADGTLKPIAELAKAVPFQTWEVLSLNNNNQVEPRPAVAFYTGEKELFEVKLQTGITFKATAGHKFLVNGRNWVELKDVKPGDLIAVPAELPVSDIDNPELTDEDIKLIAYMLGDGCTTSNNPTFTSELLPVLDEVEEVFKSYNDGLHVNRKQLTEKCWELRAYANDSRGGDMSKSISLEDNTIRKTLEKFGLWGKYSYEKTIPDAIMKGSKRQIALFLSRLYATDGYISYTNPKNTVIEYCTTSETMALQISVLLKRLGIFSSSRKFTHNKKKKETYKDYWRIDIENRENLYKFCKQILVYGKEYQQQQLVTNLDSLSPRQQTSGLNRLPFTPQEVKQLIVDNNLWNTLSPGQKHLLSRKQKRVANWIPAELGIEHLVKGVLGNIKWLEVSSITSVGVEPTYDMTVDVNHNYLTNHAVITSNSGKSFFVQCALAYMGHLLMCHNDPHATYKVSKDKPITIGNAGPSAQQCKKVVFKGYRSLMQQSQWFRDRINPKWFQETAINIQNKGIEMRSGNSSAEFFIGSNVLCAAIDEASFHIQTAEQDNAEELYTGLSRRITSRFGNKGLILTISSPKSTSDFTVRKFEEIKAYNQPLFMDEERLIEAWEHTHENGIKSLVVRAPTWGCKDRETMTPEEFEFKLGENQVLKIPMQFKKDFDKDPAKALLDFGAMPTAVSQVLYSMPHLIFENANPQRIDPVSKDGTLDPDFRPIPGMLYYAHIDLSYRRDKTVFAMCHRTANAKDKDSLPRVMIDLIKVWDPKNYPGNELPIQEVRNFVNQLRSQGFIFKIITLDQFQSRDTIQQLRLQGVKSEILSIDRNPGIPHSLKEAIYTKTLNYYQHDLLFKELQELKVVDGGKIDHPYGGSKDVADAVAGAHWNAIQDVSFETRVDFWEL